MALNIAVIAGDGIGPEVVGEALNVLDAAAPKDGLTYELTHLPYGGEHFLKTGEVISERPVELAEEPARVRRERREVAALALAEDRVERERRLARPRNTGDDRDRPAGEIDIDRAEVVLAGAAHRDRSRELVTHDFGSSNQTVVPAPFSDSMPIRPACRSRTRLQIARPRPVPGISSCPCRRVNAPKTSS